jgi:hypothetical protein
MHDRTQFERCGNSEIATHMLEGKVFEMIEQTMLDPARLRCCIDGGGGVDDRRVAQQLARVAEKLKALDDERRQIIGVYAAELMSGEELHNGEPCAGQRPRAPYTRQDRACRSVTIFAA